eukprot:GHVQ01001686.1.p1 GENE.GHVQ01001686.1~~GHVQ01001686.1.p1  ORF type:complete len:922 (+),score=184.25 GHVQ01001686.1:3862-6627(+)
MEKTSPHRESPLVDNTSSHQADNNWTFESATDKHIAANDKEKNNIDNEEEYESDTMSSQCSFSPISATFSPLVKLSRQSGNHLTHPPLDAVETSLPQPKLSSSPLPPSSSQLIQSKSPNLIPTHQHSAQPPTMPLSSHDPSSALSPLPVLSAERSSELRVSHFDHGHHRSTMEPTPAPLPPLDLPNPLHDIPQQQETEDLCDRLSYALPDPSSPSESNISPSPSSLSRLSAAAFHPRKVCHRTPPGNAERPSTFLGGDRSPSPRVSTCRRSPRPSTGNALPHTPTPHFPETSPCPSALPIPVRVHLPPPRSSAAPPAYSHSPAAPVDLCPQPPPYKPRQHFDEASCRLSLQDRKPLPRMEGRLSKNQKHSESRMAREEMRNNSPENDGGGRPSDVSDIVEDNDEETEDVEAVPLRQVMERRETCGFTGEAPNSVCQDAQRRAYEAAAAEADKIEEEEEEIVGQDDREIPPEEIEKQRQQRLWRAYMTQYIEEAKREATKLQAEVSMARQNLERYSALLEDVTKASAPLEKTQRALDVVSSSLIRSAEQNKQLQKLHDKTLATVVAKKKKQTLLSNAVSRENQKLRMQGAILHTAKLTLHAKETKLLNSQRLRAFHGVYRMTSLKANSFTLLLPWNQQPTHRNVFLLDSQYLDDRMSTGGIPPGGEREAYYYVLNPNTIASGKKKDLYDVFGDKVCTNVGVADTKLTLRWKQRGHREGMNKKTSAVAGPNDPVAESSDTTHGGQEQGNSSGITVVISTSSANEEADMQTMCERDKIVIDDWAKLLRELRLTFLKLVERAVQRFVEHICPNDTSAAPVADSVPNSAETRSNGEALRNVGPPVARVRAVQYAQLLLWRCVGLWEELKQTCNVFVDLCGTFETRSCRDSILSLSMHLLPTTCQDDAGFVGEIEVRDKLEMHVILA